MKQINIQALLRNILTPMGLLSISIFLLVIGIITLVTVRDEPEVLMTDQAYSQLENPSQIPNDVLMKLRTLQDKKYVTEQEFMTALSEAQIDTTKTSIIETIIGAVEFGTNEENQSVGYLSERSFVALRGISKEVANKLKPMRNRMLSSDQFDAEMRVILENDQSLIDLVKAEADYDYEYNLTNASFETLKANGVPDAILKKIEPLKGRKLLETEFMKQLKERIGEVDFNNYYEYFYDLNEVKYVMGLTDASFSRLRGSAVPDALLAELKPLVGQKHYEADFWKELQKKVSEGQLNEYRSTIEANLEYHWDSADNQSLIGGVITFLGALSLLIALIMGASSLAVKKKLKLEHYQGLVEESKKVSEKVRPTWDMAKATLEQYFDRNLKQINMIFYVSVFVMLVGFGIIIFAIYISIKPSPGSNSIVTPAVIGTLSGIITEFIGATFLFIYKSTVEQAIRYTSSLERINSVGMSMQILDTIQQTKETLAELNQAKISISKLLLTQTSHAQLEDGEPVKKASSKKT